MKKFFRVLFSGYFFVFLALILELGVVLFFEFFVDDFVSWLLNLLNVEATLSAVAITTLGYILIRFIAFIVGLIIFFKIVNKEEDPEFKIPWIVGMLLLPFFFSIMFLIFGNHGLNRRDKVIVHGTINAFNAHFKSIEKENNKMIDELENAVGTFRYIHNTTHLGPHKNNRVTYYKTGEEFFPELMEGLKKAKEFIFIEFFIISDGKMWSQVTDILKQKAKEGVDVRIVYDDMGCGGTISFATPRKLKKFGIKCYKFHPFKPFLSGVYNNRDHRKIVVIDHQMAFTGGINLADEYANEIERFGYWKDTMVKIEGRAINNLIATFLQNYNLCVNKVSDYNKYLTYDYPKYDDPGFVMPFGDGPGGIDNALIGEQTYINILNYAKQRVYISTPYLVPTYGLLDALRNAALRGVEVNLIVPGIPDKKIVYTMAKSNFKFLMDAGVNIYLYTPGFNHMKSAIADGELGFVGTINFDFRSLVHHFECGTILYKCNCMKEIEEDFQQMISVSEIVPQDFKMKRGQKSLCSILKIISPLF